MATEQNLKIEQVRPPSKVESGKYLNKEETSENIGEHLIEDVEENKAAPKFVAATVPSASTQKEDPLSGYHQKREVAIDSILSDGLEETFLAMSPETQKVFKAEGEKTVKKINILLDVAKLNINKIASLIRQWLSIIPGINRFFLDQEAKIKTDKIIKIQNKL